LTGVSEVLTSSFITLMMEAVLISETSVNFKVTTRRYIPEDSELHTRRRENLKSHTFILFLFGRTYVTALEQILKLSTTFSKENTTRSVVTSRCIGVLDFLTYTASVKLS
jgi:hypothetical protein